MLGAKTTDEECLHHDRCMNPKGNVRTIMATGNGCRISSINSVMVCHGKCFITYISIVYFETGCIKIVSCSVLIPSLRVGRWLVDKVSSSEIILKKVA